MEPLGGILGGEWMSLYGNYISQDDQADNYDDQLIMAADHDNNLPALVDCAVPNYNLNIMGASNFEAHPLFTNIWPCSTDSTIIHDMPAATYYGRDHAPIFSSPQIVNDQPADTLVTNNVAFCEDRNAELYLNNEGDDKNDHQWLNINQEVSCNGEESRGSQTTAAHVVPQLKWEQPDHMMITVPNQSNMEDGSLSSGNSKKRTRRTTDDQDERSYKRNVVKSRKNKKVALSENEEETRAGSGEHSDASHEELGRMMASIPSPSPSPSPKGGAPVLNLNGKARATRGSATDPQSVYARKRREKINERLRILQNLVPNGTKVDISTMLEEAVQYVKFLQLQIKLLSSDDLWMYAPLAYNGMDIGRLAAPRQ